METCNRISLYTIYIGKIKLDTLITNKNSQDKECSLTIKDVYYCHKINTNLISLRTLVRNNLSFKVSKKRLIVTNNNKDVIIKGALVNILFKLRLTDSNNFKTRKVAKAIIIKNTPLQRASV